MVECFVVNFERNLYRITLTTVIALPGFYTDLGKAVSTNVDISDDESGLAKEFSLLNLGSKQRNR